MLAHLRAGAAHELADVLITHAFAQLVKLVLVGTARKGRAARARRQGKRHKDQAWEARNHRHDLAPADDYGLTFARSALSKALIDQPPCTSMRGRRSGSLLSQATPGSTVSPTRYPQLSAMRTKRSEASPNGAAID